MTSIPNRLSPGLLTSVMLVTEEGEPFISYCCGGLTCGVYCRSAGACTAAAFLKVSVGCCGRGREGGEGEGGREGEGEGGKGRERERGREGGGKEREKDYEKDYKMYF